MITNQGKKFPSKEKKDKIEKKNYNPKRKRINWSQSLKSIRQRTVLSRKEKLRLQKSLRYVLLLRKYKNVISIDEPKLLIAFLHKSGKIKSRRKTRIKLYQQRKLGKTIRRARIIGLLPFVSTVKA